MQNTIYFGILGGFGMMVEKIKNIYISSFIYRIIDQAVSRHFRKRLRNKEFTILCSNCI